MMSKFILDTNFISEWRRRLPNEGCLCWLSAQSTQNLYLTSVTLSEIVQGIASCENEREKAKIETWFSGFIPQFQNRILSFDEKAAYLFGNIMGKARRAGKPRPVLDTMIASIALAHGCAVVTRNRADFLGLNLPIVTPWK